MRSVDGINEDGARPRVQSDESSFGISANEEIVSLTLDEIERAVDVLASIDMAAFGSKACLDISRRMDRISKRVRGLRYDVVDVVSQRGDWGARARERRRFLSRRRRMSRGGGRRRRWIARRR